MSEPALIADLAVERAQRGLLRDSKGNVVANEANALAVIRADPHFRDLHFDGFHQTVRTVTGGKSRDWGDDDDTEALEYLQRQHIPRLRIEAAARSLRKVARERERDSLVDALDALPEWDGIERIDHWAVDALGCPDTEYTRAAGANFLKGLIARATRPGAQVHECLILEGAQGIGKTRALRAIGGEFYSEITAPIGSADFMREIRGTWLADLAELSQIRRGTVEVVKQILSRSEDRYVEKYEREARCYLRRCVFAGSTNEGTYLADSTGNRRFVPLRCGSIRVDLIEASRDQWLAEARAAVLGGATWWNFPDAALVEAEEERDARRMADPWESIIADHLVDKTQVTAGELLSEAIRKHKSEQTQGDLQRAGRVLAALGWVRGKRQRQGAALVYPWFKPADNGTKRNNGTA